MSNHKKSAKDIAFDKEREKFRSEIRKQTDGLNKKQKQIDELNEAIREKDVVISQQKEWIDRLLEYTELSEDDMKQLIEKDKKTAEIIDNFRSLQHVFGRFGNFV